MHTFAVGVTKQVITIIPISPAEHLQRCHKSTNTQICTYDARDFHMPFPTLDNRHMTSPNTYTSREVALPPI